MKILRPALLLLVLTFSLYADDAAPYHGWSEAVNGLKARITFGEGLRSTRYPEVYLELQNVSDSAHPLEFGFSMAETLKWELLTRADKTVPPAISNVTSGLAIGPIDLTIPRGGILRFPVTWQGHHTDAIRVMTLGFESTFWQIAEDDRSDYFLKGSLSVPETAREPRNPARWHGAIEIPAALAPKPVTPESPPASVNFSLATGVFSAPESSSERAKWLASMAAESFEKHDFTRAEVLCLVAIELDPYCIPARKTLEKLDPPEDQGRRRSRGWETRGAAHQQLRAAIAELEEEESKVAAQQKDPDAQKYFEMARQAWKRYSHSESQLRAFRSTQGASHGYDVSYLRTLTEITKERAKQLREDAKAK